MLLRSWIEAAGLEDQVGWVSVERAERDAQRFWLAVIHALEWLELLLASLPPTLRVVLDTREDPRLGLHRLRLSGQLTELRAPDLRFSVEEMVELLRADGITLSDGAGAARSDSWIELADVKPGSWWPEYGDSLSQRAGGLEPAPKTLGSRKHMARARAPGGYVHAT